MGFKHCTLSIYHGIYDRKSQNYYLAITSYMVVSVKLDVHFCAKSSYYVIYDRKLQAKFWKFA